MKKAIIIFAIAFVLGVIFQILGAVIQLEGLGSVFVLAFISALIVYYKTKDGEVKETAPIKDDSDTKKFIDAIQKREK